jgi:uncharacterized protein YbjT (DUF2867 family)
VRALVTGASGFVGRHLAPALAEVGVEVRRAARRPEAGWVALDVDDPASVAAALAGCDAAFYLVHHLATGGDYAEREASAAAGFARAARRASLRRLVYLGGVEPRGKVSPHLQSRLVTGRILRSEFPETVELRAAMVIGRSSASFELVRSLVGRTPVVLQPPWLGNRSCPVAIDDVVVALIAGLDVAPGCYDVPGPEWVSHRELLLRVATLLGKRLRLPAVPAFPPRWAARIAASFTRVDRALCERLLAGLDSDLVPAGGGSLWDALPGHRLRPLDAAIHDALLDEGCTQIPSPRTRARLSRLAGTRRSW